MTMSTSILIMIIFSKVTPFLFLLFSTLAFGTDSWRQNATTHTVVLSSLYPGSLQRTLDNLREWKFKLERKVISEQPSITFDASRNTYSVNVTPLLPSTLKYLLFHGPKTLGPNCANSALMVAGVSGGILHHPGNRWSFDGLRYVSSREAEFYLNSSICKRSSYQEPRKTGEIGTLFQVDGKNLSFVHAFVMLDSDTIFHRAGAFEHSEWQITKHSSMLFDYDAFQADSCDERTPQTRFCTAYFSCKSTSSGVNQYLESGTPFSQRYFDILSKLKKEEQNLLKRIRGQNNSHLDKIFEDHSMQSSESNTVASGVDLFFHSMLLERMNSLKIWDSTLR